MPTYQNNIPQPTDILSDSQDDILQNFQQLSTVFGINHATYEAVNQGKHNQVTLPENAAPTNTLIDEANIYSQLSALTAQTELAWQRENNGARIEWTGLLAASNGWTRLPSGILLKWGLGNIVANPTIVNYPVAATIPVFAVPPFIALGQPIGLANITCAISGALAVANFSASTFMANTGAVGGATIFYLAIGR